MERLSPITRSRFLMQRERNFFERLRLFGRPTVVLCSGGFVFGYVLFAFRVGWRAHKKFVKKPRVNGHTHLIEDPMHESDRHLLFISINPFRPPLDRSIDGMSKKDVMAI